MDMTLRVVAHILELQGMHAAQARVTTPPTAALLAPAIDRFESGKSWIHCEGKLRFTVALAQDKNMPPRLPGKDTYVWLDLGNVLLDMRQEGVTNFMKGAQSYVQRLQQRGYKVGLITNIPGEWGKNGDYNSKYKALQDFVTSSWQDPSACFDLSIYDDVLMPLDDKQRKPAPKLFDDAMAIARALGRRSVFSGETPSEVEAAKKSGMASWLITYDKGNPTYLPVTRIPEYVKHLPLPKKPEPKPQSK